MSDTTPQKCRYDADRPCWQQEGGHFNEWCERCQWNYTTAGYRSTIDTLRVELATKTENAATWCAVADKHVDELKQLRAELAGAQSQAAAAIRERDSMRESLCIVSADRSTLEELAYESEGVLWREVATEARQMLAARDAEVPGLSPLPYYTPGDAKLIAEAKGKSYARLAVTADIADEALRWARQSKTSGTMESEDNAMRDWILNLAATGNETKEVES